jgi:dihydrofolate reductase
MLLTLPDVKIQKIHIPPSSVLHQKCTLQPFQLTSTPMAAKRKAILYIATSVDGYIAKTGDDLSFLSLVKQDGEDYGYASFIETVDTVILGRKTYDWVMTQVPEFPHADKKTYVITRTPKPSAGKVTFYSGNLNNLVSTLKTLKGGDIFIDGGAEIVFELLKDKMIDEFYISVIPVLLGAGIRLFKDGFPEQNLELIGAKSFEKGLVQLHYVLKGE